MTDLYQFTDYRAYLRDWLTEAKETTPAMSYRFLALRIGIDPGFLVHIFHGQKHLAEKHLPALTKLLRLGKRETEYFHRLVAFGKAKGERETSKRFLELMELRDGQVREVGSHQYKYYLHWYVPAIRCLIAAREFRGDYKDLAHQLMPSITPEQALEAVVLLKKLGMIKALPNGTWETVDTHLTTGDAWSGLTIRDFQKQTLGLAIAALENVPKEEREISTMTFAIPKEEVSTVQDMVREFRSRMARWAVASPSADSVYQMNIQIFPLVRP